MNAHNNDVIAFYEHFTCEIRRADNKAAGGEEREREN